MQSVADGVDVPQRNGQGSVCNQRMRQPNAEAIAVSSAPSRPVLTTMTEGLRFLLSSRFVVGNLREFGTQNFAIDQTIRIAGVFAPA